MQAETALSIRSILIISSRLRQLSHNADDRRED